MVLSLPVVNEAYTESHLEMDKIYTLTKFWANYLVNNLVLLNH